MWIDNKSSGMFSLLWTAAVLYKYLNKTSQVEVFRWILKTTNNNILSSLTPGNHFGDSFAYPLQFALDVVLIYVLNKAWQVYESCRKPTIFTAFWQNLAVNNYEGEMHLSEFLYKYSQFKSPGLIQRSDNICANKGFSNCLQSGS